jgi:large subunit ribosomal protein L15
MLTLKELKPKEGSKRGTKRIGRGTGSGWGTTSGRGNNGQKARRGYNKKLYFEGGQTPITRRLPKRGFNNFNFKVNYQIVNVGDIQKIESNVKDIDAQWLFENGLIHSKEKPVKILGNGDLSKVIEIKAHAFSQTARDKIEKVKGKAEVIESA